VNPTHRKREEMISLFIARESLEKRGKKKIAYSFYIGAHVRKGRERITSTSRESKRST